MTFRCVIWAAVSSAPQAQEDKASIPSQIANAQALIARRGWAEAVSPLVVPGISRSIDWLHEAVIEIPAMHELVEIAKTDAIDLVICRDYDRLSRTRSLLAQLSTYLNRCMVQIYAMDKPVEPIPVTELHRQRGLYSSATVEAFAGLAAEQEVARIVERRYFGMNATMRRGEWRHPAVSYGYTRQIERDGHTLYLDIPQVVPTEAQVIQRIEHMYLEEGDGCGAIAQQLNLEGVPNPGSTNGEGLGWYQTVVHRILTNPWYSGYITWGIRRKQRVYDPEQQRFLSKDVHAPAYASLKRALGHNPSLSELLLHQDELAAGDVIVTRGLHEPLRTLERQREIDRELDFRRSYRRGANTEGRCYLFSGLVVCGECGRTFMARHSRVHDKRYDRYYEYTHYTCPAQQHGQGAQCSNRRHIREDALLTQVLEITQKLSDDPTLIDEYVERAAEGSTAELKAQISAARDAASGLDNRRRRWDAAYESGVLTLEEYGRRIGSLAQDQAALEARIAALEQQLARIAHNADRKSALLAAVRQAPNLDDRPGTKLYFRRVFQEILVRDGQITRVTLR